MLGIQPAPPSPSSPTEAAFLRGLSDAIPGQERLKLALRRCLAPGGSQLPPPPTAPAADTPAVAYARALQQQVIVGEAPLVLIASRAALGSAGVAELAALIPRLPSRVAASLAVVELADDTLT